MGGGKHPGGYGCSAMKVVLRGGLALVAGGLQTICTATPEHPLPAPTAIYVDRVIEGAPLNDSDSLDESAYDSEGPLRSLRLETRLDDQRLRGSADRKAGTSIGLGFQGWLETDSWGTTSVQGAFRAGDGRGRLTWRQRQIPLESGSHASVELGVIQAPTTELLSRSSRVMIPREHLLGGSVQWVGSGVGLRQAMFTQGAPGYLSGVSGEGFKLGDGRRSLVSAQWDGWAVEHERSSGSSSGYGSLSAGSPTDVALYRSTQLGRAWSDGPWSFQFRAIRSERSHADDDAKAPLGWWMQADWKSGAQEHSAGAYRLGPHLRWAALELPNDLQGVYYRGQWSRRLWSLEGGVDRLGSIEQPSAQGFYATVFGRWRLSRWHTVSAGAGSREFLGSGSSVFVDWRWLNDLGSSGLRWEEDVNDKQRTRWVRYDQDWDMSQVLPFSTASSSVGVGAEHDEMGTWRDLLSLSLSWSVPLFERLGFRGTLGTERSSGHWSQRSYNMGLSWQLNPRWQVEGYVNQSVGRTRGSLVLDPLAMPGAADVRHDGRSVYVVARYAMSSGSPTQLMGARPGQQGGGTIRGVVYFDANRSGTQEAGETAAAGLTVVLDDRYVTVTDAQGRFEYPLVASGVHRVTLEKGSLPLPWGTREEAETSMEIKVRQTTVISIGLQRIDH